MSTVACLGRDPVLRLDDHLLGNDRDLPMGDNDDRGVVSKRRRTLFCGYYGGVIFKTHQRRRLFGGRLKAAA